MVLGMDFAGTIDAIGEGVSQFFIGDEVYGWAGVLGDIPGMLSEYMKADANLIAHEPKTLSMREAAGTPLVGITACEGLTPAQVFPRASMYSYMAVPAVSGISLCSSRVTLAKIIQVPLI